MAALAWLSSTDPKENHHAAQKLQHSGTGVWLTESEDFSRWKTNESSFLWLYGSGMTLPVRETTEL